VRQGPYTALPAPRPSRAVRQRLQGARSRCRRPAVPCDQCRRRFPPCLTCSRAAPQLMPRLAGWCPRASTTAPGFGGNAAQHHSQPGAPVARWRPDATLNRPPRSKLLFAGPGPHGLAHRAVAGSGFPGLAPQPSQGPPQVAGARLKLAPIEGSSPAFQGRQGGGGQGRPAVSYDRRLSRTTTTSTIAARKRRHFRRPCRSAAISVTPASHGQARATGSEQIQGRAHQPAQSPVVLARPA